MRLKIEAEALKKETDSASKDRLLRLEKELADLEEQSAAMTARWKAEKNKLGRAAELKKQLDEARTGLANAQRAGDWAKAGEYSYGIIPGLEKELGSVEGDGQANGAMMEEAVTPDHVAQVVSRWTGVPVDRMLEGEREKLLRMEDALSEPGRRPARGGRGRLDRGAPRPRRACRTRTGRSARSCSSGRPASARRS